MNEISLTQAIESWDTPVEAVEDVRYGYLQLMRRHPVYEFRAESTFSAIKSVLAQIEQGLLLSLGLPLPALTTAAAVRLNTPDFNKAIVSSKKKLSQYLSLQRNSQFGTLRNIRKQILSIRTLYELN